jgi:hypothetical protein
LAPAPSVEAVGVRALTGSDGNGGALNARRRVAAAAILVLGAAFLFSPPQQPHRYDNDEFIYAHTVARMKRGESYYRAASDSYKAVGGSVETTRAFRPPTAFLLWRSIPTSLLWPAYVLLVAVATGLLLLEVTTAPLVVPLVTIYLLALGRVSVEYLFAELWAVPLVAATLLEIDRKRWRCAAGLALVATAVRELAGGLLAGGLLAALMRKQPWRPWVAALVAGGALYALHTHLLEPYLGAHGTEAKLLGTGSIATVFHMAGFQLPAASALGAVIWALAVVQVIRSGQFPNLVFFVTLPLLGLIADRPYWGAIVVPFLIFWAGEEVAALARSYLGTRRRPTSS